MKGIFKFIPAALAVVALASCADSDDLFSSKSGKTDNSKIVATIENGARTRVAMGVAENGDRGIVFSEDDALNVYTTSSTDVAHYTLKENANTEKAVFEYDETGSSMDEPDLNSGDDYIAVIENTGADIIGVAASSKGPRLIMSIPDKYENVVTVDGVTWAAGAKEGTGYKMPLPLWGNVTEEEGKLAVGFQYLTGFMKIKVVNMRAGAQSLLITADKPISGYFEAYLSGSDAVLKSNAAYSSNNTITVSLENAVDAYEGVDTTFYVPMIAQTYKNLSVDVLAADGTTLENLYTSDRDITVRQGKGINLTRAMTVTEGADNGADISSKLYELTSKNAGMPVKMEIINPVNANEVITIDKTATSDITLVFFKPIPDGLKIVEGTPSSVDANGNVTWSTEKTNELSNPQTALRKVTVVYNDDETNADDMYLYLPNSEVVLAASEIGSTDFSGKITTLTSSDGGFTIDSSARIATAASEAYTNINGPITVNGFTNYIYQNGEGDVVVNNLNEKMNRIQMGTAAKNVTGALTVNGAARTTALPKNGAIVAAITSYSTGAFTYNNCDVNGGTSPGWAFNVVSTAPITIKNDASHLAKIGKVAVPAQNNLVLENMIIGTYSYTANKKATVTATGRSAIVTLTGDTDDMLTISSTWDGKTNAIPNTEADAIYYNGTKIKNASVTYADIVNSEVHTAFQLATLQNASSAITADMKSTTVIDLDNKTWGGIAQGITLKGDVNSKGAVLGTFATIKNLKNTVAPANQKVATVQATNHGFVNNVSAAVDLENLIFETVDFENGSATGALVGKSTAAVTLKNIELTGVTVKGQGNYGVGGVIGDIAGAATIEGLTVEVTEASAASYTSTDNTPSKVDGSNVGGLIGKKTSGAATIKTTSVEAAAIKGIWNLGGMIGQNVAGDATFGGGAMSDYTSVNVASFALADGAASWAVTANKKNWGSVNTYIGHVEADAVTITKYCKHGAVVSSVSAKEALNFKKNNDATDDNVNSNTLFFWSGNAWVGVVEAGTIKFPNASNEVITAVDGTNYNVYKTTPYYSAETYKDWDE